VDYRDMGFLTGIRYVDQVEALTRERDFQLQPRRTVASSSGRSAVAAKRRSAPEKRKLPGLLPSGLYLRKMRRGSRILAGLRVVETTYGPRIAVINAVGAINSGANGNADLFQFPSGYVS
jgi:hypothetical protein